MSWNFALPFSSWCDARRRGLLATVPPWFQPVGGIQCFSRVTAKLWLLDWTVMDSATFLESMKGCPTLMLLRVYIIQCCSEATALLLLADWMIRGSVTFLPFHQYTKLVRECRIPRLLRAGNIQSFSAVMVVALFAEEESNLTFFMNLVRLPRSQFAKTEHCFFNVMALFLWEKKAGAQWCFAQQEQSPRFLLETIMLCFSALMGMLVFLEVVCMDKDWFQPWSQESHTLR